MFTTMHALVMATRTARRAMCHDWAIKGCKVQPGFQFSPALREWELVGIRLKPLGNAAYVACLLLLCQGPKWLNGKSVWLVFRRSWVRIPAGSRILFRGCINALASCVIQTFQHDLLPASLAHMSWTQAASSFNILVETACSITSNK